MLGRCVPAIISDLVDEAHDIITTDDNTTLVDRFGNAVTGTQLEDAQEWVMFHNPSSLYSASCMLFIQICCCGVILLWLCFFLQCFGPVDECLRVWSEDLSGCPCILVDDSSVCCSPSTCFVYFVTSKNINTLYIYIYIYIYVYD